MKKYKEFIKESNIQIYKLKDYFENLGLKSEIIDKFIYAEYILPENKYTLLIYCHIDGKSNNELSINDIDVPVSNYIKDIESILKMNKKININIKFIIDCDEEVEEVSLPWLIKKYPEKMTTDIVLTNTGAMMSPSILCYEYKGLLSVEIEVKTLKQNLHSGSFGGPVLSATEFLINLLSKMKDKNNHIVIGGFYDDIQDTTEKISLNTKYSDFLNIIGIKSNTESGFTWQECIDTKPSFEIDGINGGSEGEGFQYIVPSKAIAKISFGLVPNQNPEDIYNKLKNFLSEENKNGITIKMKKIKSISSPITIEKEYSGNQIENSLRKILTNPIKIKFKN